jgi:1-acyl-sn-glycerol-3-phosphate acyltransferase
MRKIFDFGKFMLAQGLEKVKEYTPLLEDLLTSPREFHPEVVGRLYEGLYRTMYSHYFRTELLHPERLPRGRAVLFANHAGVVPYDALNVLVGVHHSEKRFVRPMIDEGFRPFPPLYNLLTSLGGCSKEDAPNLLEQQEMVLTFPGGMTDLNKSFLKRYTVPAVEDFAFGEYLRLAVNTHSPLVPIAIVGGEETHVNVGNIAPLAKLLKLPAFPLPLNPAPLPVKFYVEIGEPFFLEYSKKDMQDKRLVGYLNTEYRTRLERMLYDICRRREGIFTGGLR